MKLVWTFVGVFMLNVFAFCAVYRLFFSIRPYLLEEDQLIETLTAVFFLCSFLSSLFFLFKLKGQGRSKLLIAVALVGLLGLFDEIGYARIFRFSPPEVDVVDIDAVHDFFSLGYLAVVELWRRFTLFAYILVASAALLTVEIGLRHKAKISEAAVTVSKYPPYVFVLICGALLLAALPLDMGIVDRGVMHLLEELFEMHAALALLFGSISVYKERTEQKG